MKNKILCTLILALALCSSLQAQKPEKPERINRPSRWDSIPFKNEISVDVSPALSVFIAGAISGEIPWSAAATYRHFFTKKDAFRFGYRSTFEAYYSYRDYSSGFRPIAPGRTDSIVMYRSNISRRYQVGLHTLRPGYERRFWNRRVQFVLAFEMLLGVEKMNESNDTSYYETAYAIDGTGAIHHQNDFGLFGRASYFLSSYRDVWSFVLGGSISTGVVVHLSRRWDIHATVMYELYGLFPFSSHTNPEVKVKPDYKIGFQAPVADISLTFRF